MGWQEDPYGRHALRFFDGQRWTPHVRDGDVNGVDEPGGPLPEGPAPYLRSRLLMDDVFVVERFTDLHRRWSDRSVLRPDGSTAGTLRRAALTPGLKEYEARSHTRNDIVELVDDSEDVVLTLVRPIDTSKNWVSVRDREGSDLGRIVQQTLPDSTTTYAFLGPASQFLGDLQSDNWVAWDLRVVDPRGRQVATITRDWQGLDLSRLRRPDDYVVRITRPITEPLRSLVVACALSLEVVVKPTPLGF